MKGLKTQVVIVTPALADANNGNWQTARRWAAHLAAVARVRLVKAWPDADAAGDQVMIALHARRSAASVAAWHAQRGSAGLCVTLTGTDLYRDLAADADAQRSLELARILVTLQECATQQLPTALRAKSRVIFQSTTARRTVAKPTRFLRALMVGHLREEKSPQTLFAVARLLRDEPGIRIDHIGVALDPALGEAAQATMAVAPNYHWLGGLPYAETRRRIQHAHVLVHCSRMEGGAHVIMEAAACGTPVLASRVDGNVGMLGADYGGYFPWNDAEALATLLTASRRWRDGDPLLATLTQQCAARAPLFLPAHERAALRQLVQDLKEQELRM